MAGLGNRLAARAMVGAALLLSAVPAAAVVVVISPITATWSNVVRQQPVTGTAPRFSGNNTANALLSFGSNTGTGRSGYRFQAPTTLPNLSFQVNTPPQIFTLGTFTHINRPITTGTSITSARLTLNYTVTINGLSAGAFSTSYTFNHNETNNSANPCADGGANGVGINVNGCADIVSITPLNNSDVRTIQQGRITYTLRTLGFQNGLTTVQNFLTRESANNPISFVASIEAFDPVPEPSSWSLMLAGFAAVGVAVRRRRPAIA